MPKPLIAAYKTAAEGTRSITGAVTLESDDIASAFYPETHTLVRMNGLESLRSRANPALLLPGHLAEAAGSLRSPAASLLMPRSRTQFR
jgi:hypothetical protein